MSGLFGGKDDPRNPFGGAARREQERRNPGARFQRTAHGSVTPGNIGGPDQPFGINPSGNIFKRNLGGTGGGA